MTDAARLLRETKSVLLVDWPDREVPDSLARAGLRVVSHDGAGPEEYNAYEADGADVRVRAVGRPPERADLVYTHRPIDELPGIVEQARSLGARAVWLQSGLDESGATDRRGCWLPAEDSARARSIVEGVGLAYVESPYIADAVRDAVSADEPAAERATD